MTETTACPVCGADVHNEPGARGRRRIQCSKRCTARAFEVRTSERKQAERQAQAAPCLTCGDVVRVPMLGRIPKFCSLACAEIAAGRRLPQPYASRTCLLDGCGASFVPKSVRQKCCSEAHGKAYWKQVTPYRDRPDRMTEARRANLRRKTQLRRARLSGDTEAESIDRDDVGERDGWVCGLCAEAVDAALAWPDPLSASLDHVVPLSLGGKHVLTNVQVSHLRCNIAKGNRVPIAPMRGAA